MSSILDVNHIIIRNRSNSGYYIIDTIIFQSINSSISLISTSVCLSSYRSIYLRLYACLSPPPLPPLSPPPLSLSLSLYIYIYIIYIILYITSSRSSAVQDWALIWISIHFCVVNTERSYTRRYQNRQTDAKKSYSGGGGGGSLEAQALHSQASHSSKAELNRFHKIITLRLPSPPPPPPHTQIVVTPALSKYRTMPHCHTSTKN